MFWISVVVSTGFWALNMLIPTLIPSIFAGNAELKEISGWANRIYMGGAFMLGVQFSCQQTFIALGRQRFPCFGFSAEDYTVDSIDLYTAELLWG